MTDAVINIKFFASLREQVGLADVQISKAGVSTVMDAWNRATENRDMPENTLMAVNMDYVSAEHTVKVGDEVAFFPPVTGG
ncbi:MAG: molybdopterin converting factor subunit 1 [Gammaproteobacteria bacterium]|nr:molybdopterin converting factor subunit 1 [Gammaproteobacteria bacterium]